MNKPMIMQNLNSFNHLNTQLSNCLISKVTITKLKAIKQARSFQIGNHDIIVSFHSAPINFWKADLAIKFLLNLCFVVKN